MDKLEKPSDIFRFKHHYVLHALDSDILCDLLLAISERRAVELFICSLRNGRDYQRTVCPLKIYSSTQSGRQYLPRLPLPWQTPDFLPSGRDQEGHSWER